jgi:hypothetical protein
LHKISATIDFFASYFSSAPLARRACRKSFFSGLPLRIAAIEPENH